MLKRSGLLIAALAGLLGACVDASEDALPDATTAGPVSFTVLIENVAPWTVLKSGVAATKVVPGSGPLSPGEAFEATFTAGKNQRLSFAAMLGESNDWFFGPGPDGIALYDDGVAVSGDVTSQVSLWNAGTELDQEPGVGDATGPNQAAPDAGAADPDPTIREIAETSTLSSGATFTRPAIAEMIQVTLTPGSNGQFTVRIANVSTETTLQTSAGARSIHVSPAVWALHGGSTPLFVVGEPDRGQGLEQLAESGRGAGLASVLGVLGGVPTPVSPGVYALHRGDSPLYALGVADPGLGLERIAESGDPSVLAEAIAAGADGVISSAVFDTPVGAAGPGAVRPGGAYQLEVTAEPGDRLSFVTMFGMSNDWFFATDLDGLALFDAAGAPLDGDVSEMIGLYDVGTELDEELAIGPNTGPQQPDPDAGLADPIDQVRVVPAGRYGAPASTHLRVTVTPR